MSAYYPDDDEYIVHQYETNTSILTVAINKSNNQIAEVVCLCTTNDCNIDMTTSTLGMNLPSYSLLFLMEKQKYRFIE
ncbi:hypothetical protein I4U23_023554 [Adineta vaga]|nr:hypothetical protein I4U23_023554 [Adineta vaga]